LDLLYKSIKYVILYTCPCSRYFTVMNYNCYKSNDS